MKETKADRKREFGRKMDNTEHNLDSQGVHILSMLLYIMHIYSLFIAENIYSFYYREYILEDVFLEK